MIRLLLLVLLAGAALLGALQVFWVNAATREEEFRLRAMLSIGAIRVRREATDEVSFLASLMTMNAAELRRGSWDRVEERVRFWLQSARFPELLHVVYIIPNVGSRRGFVYSSRQERYVEVLIPGDLADLVRSQLLALESDDLREREAASEAAGYVVLVADDKAPDGSTVRPQGAVAVRLNLDALYTKLVPGLVARYLDGFSYRVRDTRTGSVLAEAGAIAKDARPEAVEDLSDLTAGVRRQRSAQGPDSSSAPLLGDPASVEDDPSLRYWLYQVRTDNERPVVSPSTGVVLEIYYAQGPISTVVRLSRALSIGVSTGILSILVLSAFVLYELYRRSVKLRENEQEFVASVSHELRTPITVIQATSENLKRGVVSEPNRVVRYAGVINEQVRRLAGMVESILFYSGLQSGVQRDPACVEVNLRALVGDIAIPLRGVAAEKGSTLVVDQASIPEQIRSDATALRLIIENLIMNALRHGGPGETRLRVVRKEGALWIVVEDDGPGIPPREQKRVFEPFYRGARSQREQKPGSGLGLHLVRRVSKGLGGRVLLESPYSRDDGRERTGCRFSVVLPWREVAAHG